MLRKLILRPIMVDEEGAGGQHDLSSGPPGADGVIGGRNAVGRNLERRRLSQ
jgi:hypothetical protein